jgi:dTDP-4-amino-4,6-dideoxygalactose transaminase
MGFFPRFSMRAPLIIDISVAKLLKIALSSANQQSTPRTIALANSPHVGDIFHSVRATWDLILQVKNLPKGSEIIMSGINIKHMKEIVEAHGLVPVFADLEPNTLLPSLAEIASHRTSRTAGVLCAHLFGTWSPLTGLAEWCRSENLFLIEDCAQAFMGKNFLGTPGATASLFSFGTIKRASALGGSVAIVRDASLRNKMLQLENNYEEQSEEKLKRKAGKILALKAACEQHAYKVIMKGLQWKFGTHEEILRNAVRGFPGGSVPEVFRIRPSAMQRHLVIESWNASTQKHWESRGKKIFAEAQSAGISANVFLGHKAQVHSFWLLPITSEQAEETMQQARQQGWDATRGVTSMTALANNPNTMASRILEKVVYLPISQETIPCFSSRKSIFKNSPAQL